MNTKLFLNLEKHLHSKDLYKYHLIYQVKIVMVTYL